MTYCENHSKAGRRKKDDGQADLFATFIDIGQKAQNAVDGFSAADVAKGNKLRDKGIKRAADHADKVEENWQDQAYRIFSEYASGHNTFATEEVREFAHRLKGLADPPDARAWGAVARRAVVQGLISHDHFAESRNPKKHRCPLRVWRTQEKLL